MPDTSPEAPADVRLIERWLPIAALGIESLRERTPMTPFPAPNRLHVWWARRPLIASRAAILASLLPADADHEKFLHAIGIHGDPVAGRKLIDLAVRTGMRCADPYGYARAFSYTGDPADREWLAFYSRLRNAILLDSAAGGGTIPFEAVRLGIETLANDLNPVSACILRATVGAPLKFGGSIGGEYQAVANRFLGRARELLSGLYLTDFSGGGIDATYLFARTVRCPYCEGVIPLSPNWRLSSDGTGVRLLPGSDKQCRFEIVATAAEQSPGTVADGDARCCYPGCGRTVDGDEIKRQAQAGQMGEQLYCVVYKRPEAGKGKRVKWVRGFRAPRPEDENSAFIRQRLAEKLPEWDALGIVPNEAIPEGLKTAELIRYGMSNWRDLFSPRQLLCHGTSVEIFRELVAADRAAGQLTELRQAAYIYLALSLDKLRDYNSRLTHWHVNREVVVNTFDRHDFAFKWSYVEMAPLIAGLGFDWAIEQTAKCIRELVALVSPGEAADGKQMRLDGAAAAAPPPPVTITCKSADGLDHIADHAIDVVVIDPPYEANVMYAELSDFFYVWLKRTAGFVDPSLFKRALTDKEQEAVANAARFKGQKGASELARRDYQEKMARIFAECRRVLKPDGIMTLMFTHKAAGAWDALTTGLMQAGFRITASWPINTEAEGSLHIKDKAAANSTIFLACRPRPKAAAAAAAAVFWEDVEPLVARAVRQRVAEFQAAGIGGVDLYLASFGPALEEFSRHWPMRRGTPRPPEQLKKRSQARLFPERLDPYAVTPEDALDAARREVKRWRLEQLTHVQGKAELDPVASWFVLAWDAFRAPVFDYDEGLRLARAVGVDLEEQIIKKLAEKKGSQLRMWDSSERAARHAIGAGSSMLNMVHLAAYLGRTGTLDAAREMLKHEGLEGDGTFQATLRAVLEVLPVSSKFSQKKLGSKELENAASDFEALEGLRRLAFSEQLPQPAQLTIAFNEAEELREAAAAVAANPKMRRAGA